jgi:hypothetical protein
MIPEEEMRLRVRLAIAEHLASSLMAVLWKTSGYSDATIEALVRSIGAKYAADTWPGLDAVTSDMLAAESEDAARDLLAEALRIREERSRQG